MNKYWIATTTTDWNDPTAWSTTSGGSNGTSVPNYLDTAIFDINSVGNCLVNNNLIDMTGAVSNIITEPTFTAEIIISNNIRVDIYNDFTVGGGDVIFNNSNVYVMGDLFFDNSSIDLGTSNLYLAQDATFGNLTSFSHNFGNIILEGNSETNYTIGFNEFNLPNLIFKQNKQFVVNEVINAESIFIQNGEVNFSNNNINTVGDFTLVYPGSVTSVGLSGVTLTTNHIYVSGERGRRLNMQIPGDSGTDFNIIYENPSVWKFVNVDGIQANHTDDTEPIYIDNGDLTRYNVNYNGENGISESTNCGVCSYCRDETTNLPIPSTLSPTPDTVTVRITSIRRDGTVGRDITQYDGDYVLTQDGDWGNVFSVYLGNPNFKFNPERCACLGYGGQHICVDSSYNVIDVVNNPEDCPGSTEYALDCISNNYCFYYTTFPTPDIGSHTTFLAYFINPRISPLAATDSFLYIINVADSDNVCDITDAINNVSVSPELDFYAEMYPFESSLEEPSSTEPCMSVVIGNKYCGQVLYFEAGGTLLFDTICGEIINVGSPLFGDGLCPQPSDPGDCHDCVWCKLGTVPQYLTVDISGTVDADCSSCSNLNTVITNLPHEFIPLTPGLSSTPTIEELLDGMDTVIGCKWQGDCINHSCLGTSVVTPTVGIMVNEAGDYNIVVSLAHNNSCGSEEEFDFVYWIKQIDFNLEDNNDVLMDCQVELSDLLPIIIGPENLVGQVNNYCDYTATTIAITNIGPPNTADCIGSCACCGSGTIESSSSSSLSSSSSSSEEEESSSSESSSSSEESSSSSSFSSSEDPPEVGYCPCCAEFGVTFEEFSEALNEGLCKLKATVRQVGCRNGFDGGDGEYTFCDARVSEIVLTWSGPEIVSEGDGFCIFGCEWRIGVGNLDVSPCNPENDVTFVQYSENCDDPAFNTCVPNSTSPQISCCSWNKQMSIGLQCGPDGWILFFNPYGCFPIIVNTGSPGTGCVVTTDGLKWDTYPYTSVFETCDLENFFLQYEIPVSPCWYPNLGDACDEENGCHSGQSCCCEATWVITIERLVDSPLSC